MESSALTPQLYKTLHPRPYLSKFLAAELRPDGRQSPRKLGRKSSTNGSAEDGWRDVSINTGSVSTAAASSLVRFGNSTVLCGISLETATPDAHEPAKGFLVPNVDLPALCSPQFRPGPPSDQAQALSARLRDILIASKILPLESLLIEDGLAAFVVYIDIVCLSHDGNILDAAFLSAVSALRTLRLPDTRWDEDALACVSQPISPQHPGRPSPIADLPFCITFAIYDGRILPDPTAFETDLASSLVTLVVSSQTGKLLHIHQAGSPLPAKLEAADDRPALKVCVEMAQQRAKYLASLVEQHALQR